MLILCNVRIFFSLLEKTEERKYVNEFLKHKSTAIVKKVLLKCVNDMQIERLVCLCSFCFATHKSGIQNYQLKYLTLHSYLVLNMHLRRRYTLSLFN